MSSSFKHAERHQSTEQDGTANTRDEDLDVQTHTQDYFTFIYSISILFCNTHTPQSRLHRKKNEKIAQMPLCNRNLERNARWHQERGPGRDGVLG